MKLSKFLNYFKIPIDIILSILIIPSSLILFFFRYFGGHKFKLSKFILKKIGVFPIIKNYYEPVFDFDDLKYSLNTKRNLHSIDLNIDEQLKFLNKLNYYEELKELNFNLPTNNSKFYIKNNFFEGGDADIYYQLIRYLKPKKIVEIGSGYSSLVALQAIKNNFYKENFTSNILCIEPYENKWLEDSGIEVIRDKVENIEENLITSLEKNDVLFVDSSHIIRPQGDILKIFLEILPKLKKGVLVHIHDIFTPRDYPSKWLKDENRFYNEQYLFEALISHSSRYKILCSLNYLKNDYYVELKKACPYLDKKSEPSSVYVEIV